jgi:hypothetical protein
MQDKDRLARLRTLVRGGRALAAPSVEPLEPVIRSGDTFLFRDPRKRGATAEEQECIRESVEKGFLIESFVVEWGYNIKRGQHERFRRWLLDNERHLAASAPLDVLYKGTYVVTSSTEREAGEYRTIWAFHSLQGPQNLAFELADGQAPFTRLWHELNEFRDGDSPHRSQQNYSPAATAIRLY